MYQQAADQIRFEMDCNASEGHFHPELELLYVLAGRLTMVEENTSISLGPEDFIVINPCEHHEVIQESGCHTLSLFIPVQILSQAGFSDVRCCSCLHPELRNYYPLIRAKMAMLYRECMESSSDRSLYAEGEMYQLLAILKEHFAIGNTEMEVSGEKSFRDVLLYVESHFTEPVTLQDAADAVFLSRGYLTRLFQRRMKTSFSDYLQTLRLNRALRLLISTRRSITEIAMDCGFSTVNTFILNFQKRFGETPGAYRKKHLEHESKRQFESNAEEQTPEQLMISLLHHAGYEERVQLLSRRSQPQTNIRLQTSAMLGPANLNYQDSISVGWAGMLLQEGIRNAVRRAIREIGYRHVTLLGILDDAIGIYYEMANGEPALSFTYMDMILDFVLSTGAKPSPILCYLPKTLLGENYQPFGSSFFGMPRDLDKWIYLVEGIMNHLVERYGMEELNQWRFPLFPGTYIDFGIFSYEEYYTLYQRTMNIVRSVLPDAAITGCQLDLDLADMNGYQTLERFLTDAAGDHCLPDILTFQCFYQHYQEETLEEAKAKTCVPAELDRGEPAPCHPDPDWFKKQIVRVREILSTHGLEDMPIQILMWNSTIWQADPVNDTCYKSAFLIKHFAENTDSNLLLTYSALTDNNERRIISPVSFHGGFGLMTYQGIPKAGYWALTLLRRMHSVEMARGDGYWITRSQDQKKIQICLYNYCHYDQACHIRVPLSPEEMCTRERYSGLEEKGIRGFQIAISGMQEGKYSKETYSISKSQGSAYDQWMRMGAPMALSQAQQEYLEKTAIPGYQFEQVRVRDNGELILSTILDDMEVQIICLEKR